MLKRRLGSLLFRRGLIQAEIEPEQVSPDPDTIRLFRLKRLRLVLQDRIRRIARALQAECRRASFPIMRLAADVQPPRRPNV